MRYKEIVMELGDRDIEYVRRSSLMSYYTYWVDKLNLVVSFVEFDVNCLDIEFQVGGVHTVTGKGNAIAVFSAVNAIINDNLVNAINKTKSTTVVFGADLAEPSRVRLYNAIVPRISNLLGSQWDHSTDIIGTDKKYIWKKNQ